MPRHKGDGLGRCGGGRKKGTPNKVGREMRESLANIIDKYFTTGIGKGLNSLETDLCNMAPEDRAKVVAQLVPYVVPKLSSVEIKDQATVKSFRDELDALENS